MGSGWRSRRNSEILEARIWSSLPEDLLLRVLAFLPIKKLLRLRCVSSRWNEILTSPSFARFLAQVPKKSDLPWILTFRSSSRTLKAFDRSINRWFRLRLSFLPCSSADLVAASKGLLCFLTGSGEFLISNPLLLHSWRALPPPDSDFPSSVSLVSEEDGFRVVVMGSDRRMQRVIEVFSSASNSWRLISQPPLASSLFRSETAFWNRQLFFATRSEPPSLLSLDLDALTWREVQPLPQSLVFCIPVVASGVLHLVGGFGAYGIAKSMSIWRLSSGSGSEKWEEIERMPEAAWTKLAMSCYHSYEKIGCTSQEDLICFFCCSWCLEMLVFCIAQRCWIWLPVSEQATSRGVRWFSLEPNILGP